MLKILARLESQSETETIVNLISMHKVDFFKKGESLQAVVAYLTISILAFRSNLSECLFHCNIVEFVNEYMLTKNPRCQNNDPNTDQSDFSFEQISS